MRHNTNKWSKTSSKFVSVQLKVKVAPKHPLIARLAHTLYSLQLLRIYAATLSWVWSLLDLSMSAPKFIRISHSHSITKSNSMTMTIMMLIPILIRCHSIRFSFRICLLVLLSNEKHFVFCFLVFLFSFFSFCFPILFCLFSCCCDFYCFLVLFRLVCFIFTFYVILFTSQLQLLPSCTLPWHSSPPVPLCHCLARPLVQYLTPSPSLSRLLLSCSPALLLPSPSRFL